MSGAITWQPRAEQVFNVGDFITLKDEAQRGVVYRVAEVQRDERYPQSPPRYVLTPTYGAFGAADKRGVRIEAANSMNKLDLVTAGIEHLRMQNFIRELARHEGAE